MAAHKVNAGAVTAIVEQIKNINTAQIIVVRFKLILNTNVLVTITLYQFLSAEPCSSGSCVD